MTTVLHILQHALGRDQFGRSRNGRPDYRNHFCTGPGTDNFPLCREAVALGLMLERPPSQISGGDNVFTVTDAGREYIRSNSPREPRVSRGRARYLRYLRVADVVDVSFGEWLKAETAKGS